MNVDQKVNKAIIDLDVMIKGLEKDHVNKRILKEIPISTLGLFPPDSRARFKSVYLDNRLNNVSVQKSIRLAISLTSRVCKDKKSLLASIEKEMKKIKGAFFADSETPENWGPASEDIPAIDKPVEDSSGIKVDKK